MVEGGEEEESNASEFTDSMLNDDVDDFGFSNQNSKSSSFKSLSEYIQGINSQIVGRTTRDVPNDAIKLMLFLYSLEGASRIWDSSSKTDDRIDKLADQISNLVEIVNKQVITPATAKVVEKTCVICGGAHAYYDCIATDSNQPSICAATEPDVPKTQPKPNIPYPSRLNDQKLREKATNQMEKFFQIFHDLHFDISFVDALLLMPKFASTIKSLLTNKDKLFELAKVPLNENCSAMLLKKLTEKIGDPDKFLIRCDFPGIDLSLPELTPTRMTLELADRSITHPKGVAEDVFIKVRKFHFPTDFVVVDFEADPRVPLILGRSFLRTGRAIIDVYGEEITLRYNSKSSNPTLVSNPSFSEETKSEFSKEPILEEIEDFLKDESIPTGIEDSFYDPEEDILYLEKLLNDDPFQLHPMDLKQAEETKAKSSIEEPPELELKESPSHLEYAFLEDTDKLPVIIAKDLKDVEKEALLKVLKSHKRAIAWKISDIKGYFQILIDPQDQEKTTFTCPYGTFAYRRMPFGLCNTPDKMLKRCEDTNLVLNWEKYHFMCKEEIVLGHKISKSGIEVDRAKVDVIAKLHHPTTVKGVRSFLGHAGFYRHFIQDFSKIARPMTHLFEKETPFVLSKECINAFETLKKKLTEASILVVPDWNPPFELMCDASDFAIGACVHGQEAIDILKSCHEGPTGGHHERTVGENRASWSDKLDDALWAFRIAFKTPIGCTPYKMVYGKSCHLPIELEHKAYWALKHVNFDLKTAGDHRKLQLNELNELRDLAYENSLIYKERTKKLHDYKIKNRFFNVGDQVLLFNSRLKIFLVKLKTRWSGPFTITQVFPYGTVELSQPDGPNFKVNGHRVKHYFESDIPSKDLVIKIQNFHHSNHCPNTFKGSIHKSLGEQPGEKKNDKIEKEKKYDDNEKMDEIEKEKKDDDVEKTDEVVKEKDNDETNKMIKEETLRLVNLAVNKDREVDTINVPELISKEFTTHGPKMIEELFRRHMQNRTLNLYPTTSSSTVDLQQQLYLNMKIKLQDQVADPEL
uniref:Reverse transcriptase domain-containing protein n=1 Tax=Tanacetum cinerariifolium TaxID=118510 RepID=A0A6L2NXY7_TANCI|nr:reverse transcriptase domain-containing protein [Tanacetum cinerariifolium]